MKPVRPLQRKIITALGVQPAIDPGQEIQRRVQFLFDYLRASKAKGYVLGISGGIDSTLAGRMAQLAVERVRAGGGQATFVAMRLPYKAQRDEADAVAALSFVGADEIITYNVAPGVAGFEAEYLRATGLPLTDFTKGNTKARVRMAAQYAVAGDRDLLVIGTDHGAESVTGFFTKFGDGAADVLPLWGSNKRQNQQMLRQMGAVEQLIQKVPTADLLDKNPGRADEDELGLTYEHIDDYLEGREVDDEIAERIESIYIHTRHKRTMPLVPTDTWWRHQKT